MATSAMVTRGIQPGSWHQRSRSPMSRESRLGQDSQGPLTALNRFTKTVYQIVCVPGRSVKNQFCRPAPLPPLSLGPTPDNPDCPGFASRFSPDCPDYPVISSALGDLGQPPDQVRIDLRLAIGREQPVLLLLDVGELRVAEALHRAWIHERVDQRAVRAHELIGVLDLQPSPAALARLAEPPKLAHEQRLAAVRVAGVVRGVLIRAAVQRGLERAIPSRQVLWRSVVVERAEVAARVLPPVVRDDR